MEILQLCWLDSKPPNNLENSPNIILESSNDWSFKEATLRDTLYTVKFIQGTQYNHAGIVCNVFFYCNQYFILHNNPQP